jgi:hypothetical protein
MEKQIILSTRLGKELGYFSVWKFGKRVPGNFDPYIALMRGLKDEPYQNEKMDHLDAIVLLECLIMWDEE